MSAQAIVERLHVSEIRQQENLVSVLGALKGSRVAGSKNQLPSMVRGLCTINQKLLQLSARCLAAFQNSDEETETFKLFINKFIMWFDTNFVVFEKLHLCVASDELSEGEVFQMPLRHCSNYVDLANSASTSIIRNPYIIEKLNEVKARSTLLIEKNNDTLKQCKLNDISFDHVQTFGGKSVSCFFTSDQIVKRTESASLFMGETKVEMVLLNLRQGKQPVFDSLAILEVPDSAEKRSVVYPPFRVNELAISHSCNCINFSSISLDSSLGTNYFAITGDAKVIDQWFENLTQIFPTEDKPVQSKSVQLFGLGIKTILDFSDDAHVQQTLPCTSQEPEAPEKELTRFCDTGNSFNIMKKTLSHSGIEAEDLERQLTVVDPPTLHLSICAEYAYPQNIDAEMSLMSDDCNNTVFDSPKHGSPLEAPAVATASKPDLLASLPQPPSVYINAAGSAIDLSNFGKTYNPSFASSPAAGRKVVKKKSFLDLFKKRRNNVETPTITPTQPSAHVENTQPEKVEEKEDSSNAASQEEPLKSVPAYRTKHPSLKIKIPRNIPFATSLSQPGSALSTTKCTLPLPFALPSSTSTYFFKPYLNNIEANEPSVSLMLMPDEKPYEIPQEFKDVVNSDATIDYYITPTSPNSMKVSKWKQKYSKWELLTANENVFLKIVANYDTCKSWLLVFKEEYDEKYNEVIDKPLLVLDLDENTSTRQSSALDVEIQGVDALSQQKTDIIVRCYNSALVEAISSNLNSISEMVGSKKTLRHSSNSESSVTLESSLMNKPSTSSTLTSISTHNDQKQTSPSMASNSFERDEDMLKTQGTKLLLDRMTIKLHKQMESYEQIHKASSWKSIAMYALCILHSIDSLHVGSYHLDMTIKNGAGEGQMEAFLWSFKDEEIRHHIQRIGKAAMLVKASATEIYMLECKGKKELNRLANLF